MSELCDLSAAIVGGPEVSSYVISEETSSYVIKVDGYSSIKRRLKHDEYVKSIPFSVGGHNWFVTYYPNGCPTQTYRSGFSSVFLVLDSAMAKDVKAKARFSLLDKDGEPVESKSGTMGEFILNGKGSGWGLGDFIKKADLERSVHLRDDSFSIRCDVTVLKHINKGNQFVAVPPTPSNLHQHLGNLLKSMDGADVTFHVGGESFSAHRAVLAARSSVFRAELFGAMKKNAGSPIEISDMKSDVFRSLLHFIYTDSLPHGGDAQIDRVMAYNLLVAAHRYNMERLKLVCEERLCSCSPIDSDTVATSLALAEMHELHRMKQVCFEFLASPSNLEAMMASDGYEHLKNNCPSLLKELAASFMPAELKAVKDIIMTV